MYISKRTIEWLRKYSHSDNRIYIHENCSNIEMMFAMDALRHDLIEPDRPVGKDEWLEEAQEYMEIDAFAYRLTLTGEAELAQPTPPQAEAERGTVEHPEYNLGIFLGKYRHLPHANIGNQTACGNFVQGEFKSEALHKLSICPECMEASHPAAPQPVTADAPYTATDNYVYSDTQQIAWFAQDAPKVALILNQQTQALRSQLHAANEKVAALEAANEQWKQHRELLEVTLTSCKQLYDGEQVLMAEKCREVDFMQDRIDDLNQMVDEARQERDSLKARLAECEHAHELASKQRDAATELYNGKHERIEELKRELEVSRNARKALEYVINHAFKELRTYDGNNGAIIAAKLMLEPYTMPESE